MLYSTPKGAPLAPSVVKAGEICKSLMDGLKSLRENSRIFASVGYFLFAAQA